MVVHVVAITLGKPATSTAGLWGTIVDFVVNYPGMLLAVAGTAALVMVTVTSIKAARSRLRYESWHLLHLYAYLGVGLALPQPIRPTSRSWPPERAGRLCRSRAGAAAPAPRRDRRTDGAGAMTHNAVGTGLP